MAKLLRALSLALAAVSTIAVAACGGSGGIGGNGASISAGAGSISITSFSPSTILGCAPTPFVITGTNFQDVTGTTAIVKFTATTGGPFGGSAVATVIGTVISGTTITGTTPAVTLCGVASISVTVDVTLESGVSTSTTGTGITISLAAPTVTTFSPNPVPAAIPTAFTITGTGFTPGAVTVRFVSANLGDLNFQDGTSDSVDVAATATTSTTITGETPLARACTANFTSSVQVIEPDGCCTAPTAATFLTWLAPTITSGAFATLNAVIPTPIVVTGTNLGVAGEIGTVRLTQGFPPGFGLLFNNFGSSTIDLPGVVGAGGLSINVTTPAVSLCGLPTGNAFMRWIAPRGSSCADHPAGIAAATFVVPTITTISTPTVPALVPTAYTLTFSNTISALPQPFRLVFNSPAGAIFADGTSTSFSMDASSSSPTTIAGLTPAATLCGVDTATASITAYFPGGSCTTSAPGLLTFQGPALATASPGGIQNPNLPVASFPNNNMFSLAGKEPFILNALPGRSFGTTGAFVEVRFSGGGNIWQGGAQSFDTVVGQVTSSTTIAGATPSTVSTSLTIVSVTVQALFEDGSCSGTTAAQFTQTSQRTFAAGTGGFFTINQNGTGAPALIGVAVGITPTTGVAVDARRNRLATVSNPEQIWDTSQTMLGTPVVPTLLASPASNLTPTGVAMAPDLGVAWFLAGSVSANLGVVNLGNNAIVISTIPFVPVRVLYNQPAGEMLIASPSSAQLVLFNVTTQTIDAIFGIPAVGAAVWNGVTGLRPGASGSARGYMLYDDPAAAGADAVGAISFATGVITTTPLVPGTLTPTIPGSLVYESRRDRLLAWFQNTSGLYRMDPVTVVVAGSQINLLGVNVVALSMDPIDDRYYLSDAGAGTLITVDAATAGVVNSLAVPAAGANASTSP